MTIEEIIAKFNLPFTPAELQIADAYDAAMAGRFLLAYDVGGGKTLVGTIVAKYWEEDTTVIVMPHILLPQWKRWLNSVGEMDVSIYYGPKRTDEMLDHKWVLMSHSGFRDSFDTIQHRMSGRTVAVLLDEAQAIKNVESKLYKKLKKFIQPDRNLVMMTATPTSKLEDTYAYMSLKTPELYRNWGHWHNLHVEKVDIFKNPVSYQNLDVLKTNFAIKMVKRNKTELFGDTLMPIYQDMAYDLDAKHMKLYVRLAEEQLLMLPDGGKIDATTAQSLRHKLQQIVTNYSMFSGIETDRSTAYDLVDEVIEETNPFGAGRSKLVIWVWYQATSKALTAYLREKHGREAVAAAYGGVDSAKGVRQIMYDEDCRLAVFHPQSVGAGLELQHVCHEMLFMEMSTSPIYMRQAIGRVDRPGQRVRPTIRFGQAQGTIQLKLYADLLKNDDLTSKVENTKQSLRQQIFGGG